jgi:hypothetical protein
MKSCHAPRPRNKPAFPAASEECVPSLLRIPGSKEDAAFMLSLVSKEVFRSISATEDSPYHISTHPPPRPYPVIAKILDVATSN